MSEQPNDLLGFTPAGSGEFTETKPARQDAYQQCDIELMTDESRLQNWMRATSKIPLDAIDAHMVNKSYPALVWLFRKAAIEGDIKHTKALEAWLAWAKPIIERPEKPVETAPSIGSDLFGARPVSPNLEDE